jgi:pimeloyl-ACP methyl ester carboxylesterase
MASMPEGTTLDVDIVCHSRGGLVSRVLAERQDQVLVAGRTVRVHKVVFVGSPNAGTRLCEEDFITDYLDTLTNLLSAYPLPGAADIVAGVVMLAKIGAAGLYSALTGIHSMQPEGLFGKWLNAGTRAEHTRYFALTSNFKPTDLALARLATYVLAGRVFKGARNDLVVPTDGVFAANGSSAFPITDMVAFDGKDGIPHTGFFGDTRVTAQIANWLAS